MYTDAHFHMNVFEIGFADIAEKIEKGSYSGLVSTHSKKELDRALEMKKQWPGKLFVSAGILPLDLNNEFLPEIAESLQKGDIDAIGEYGFDFFKTFSKEDFERQELFFSIQSNLAIRFQCPVVLHVRKGIHTVFSHLEFIKRCQSVIFHSFSGTHGEMITLLNKGVNAFFSFGNSIIKGNKKAISACKRVPKGRLLLETDAPFQPLKGRKVSTERDMPAIVRRAAEIRSENVELLQKNVNKTFLRLFNK